MSGFQENKYKMKLKPLPREGDKRTVKKFAFLGVTLGTTDMSGNIIDAVPEVRIWLEFYREDQIFHEPWWTPMKRYQIDDNTTK